ncbi:MAG: FkbM family methyltransferase [Nitrospiraceae bacterium]
MSLLKWLAVTILPGSVLFFLKRIYYTRTIQTFWEPDIEPIKRLVKPGDVAIDLGANIGWYSHVLAKLVGVDGRVYSIEPIPDTFRLLSAVASARGLKNVELLNVAVSDNDGFAVMEIPLHEYGGKNFYMAKIVSNSQASGSANRRYTVAVRSMDSMFQDVATRVSFIKCDVEGHELAAFKGGEKFFETQKPAIMLEVAGQFEKQGSSAHELYGILKRYGYKAFIYDGKHLKERPAGHWSVNYFFLQPSHLNHLADMVA